jgi:hypothetical protein
VEIYRTKEDLAFERAEEEGEPTPCPSPPKEIPAELAERFASVG